MEKWFLKSKTIWGALIGFLPGLFTLVAGEPVDPELMASTKAAGESFITAAWGLVDAANELVGAVLVVWGRLTAKSRLTAV